MESLIPDINSDIFSDISILWTVVVSFTFLLLELWACSLLFGSCNAWTCCVVELVSPKENFLFEFGEFRMHTYHLKNNGGFSRKAS